MNKKQSERGIQNEIMIANSQSGVAVWRNNTFSGWAGKLVSNNNGRAVVENARFVRGGLCEGSADLIGITPVKITPDMVGTTVGVFTGQEVKTQTGRVSQKQNHFGQFVISKGGIWGVVRSIEDSRQLLEEWRFR